MIFLKKELGFTLDDIKQMTTLQVNMYIQRYNEPGFKMEIERELNKGKK